MVVKNITNFLNDSDKYGQKVGDWALQAGDGLFKCPVNLVIPTMKEFIKYSESV